MATKPTNPKDTVGIRKAPISTVSTTAFAETAHAIHALKSLRRVPLTASAAFNVAMSGLLAWWEGAEVFPVTKLHPIPSCLAALMILRESMLLDEHLRERMTLDGSVVEMDAFVDDRPPHGIVGQMHPAAHERAGQILDHYAEREPHHYTLADEETSPTPAELSAEMFCSAPWSELPGAVLVEVGLAMLEGAAKYGRHNYRAAGVRASVYVDATFRHLNAWWAGEDIDPDSGVSHVTKAITSLTVVRDAQFQGKFSDDRPPRAKTFSLLASVKA
jgi:hypothetical protein